MNSDNEKTTASVQRSEASIQSLKEEIKNTIQAEIKLLRDENLKIHQEAKQIWSKETQSYVLRCKK